MTPSACTAIHLAHLKVKAQFNTAIPEHGIQSVITAGTVEKEMWPVNSLALAKLVSVVYVPQKKTLECVASALIELK